MNYNIGHRARLRDRLLKSKSGQLPDYELLELLLCLALPRKDTKQLAKDLIVKHKTFADVITAERESLMDNQGVGESVLACFKLVQEAVIRITKEELIQKPIISSWHSLINYCRASIGHNQKESFMILYLNNQNELISEELQEYGTIDQISVYPREIAKRALLLNASAIILVHNHPSGNTKASKADIDLTNKIANALSAFKIIVHDHIIISKKGAFSFKSEGLL
jgi:DNA repair protein RadC